MKAAVKEHAKSARDTKEKAVTLGIGATPEALGRLMLLIVVYLIGLMARNAAEQRFGQVSLSCNGVF